LNLFPPGGITRPIRRILAATCDDRIASAGSRAQVAEAAQATSFITETEAH
jgi:hypothetical protein